MENNGAPITIGLQLMWHLCMNAKPTSGNPEVLALHTKSKAIHQLSEKKPWPFHVMVNYWTTTKDCYSSQTQRGNFQLKIACPPIGLLTINASA